MVTTIVSGGQTGVDRAALDVALQLGVACGGWCPLGRRAEDGVLPERYPLKETPTANYPERTEWNVRDSDGTLVLMRDRPRGGTALTIELARRMDKPCFQVDLTQPIDWPAIHFWLTQNNIAVLNVAGPRESENPGIRAEARAVLLKLMSGA